MINANRDLAKKLVDLLVKMFFQNIWRGRGVCNLIAQAIFQKDNAMRMKVAKFLIVTTYRSEKDLRDCETQEDLNQITSALGKTLKFQKHKIKKLKRQMKHVQKKKVNLQKLHVSRFKPIELLYSPGDYADKLLELLLKDKHQMKNELKIELTCLVGSLIGTNELVLPQYYQYVHKFLFQGIQAQNKVFKFVSESIHAHCPIEEV